MRNEFTRRSFLRVALVGGGVVAADGGLAVLSSQPAWAAASGDVDILNFALVKEYLELDFYQQATASGKITDSAEQGLLQALLADEQAHVQAVSGAVSQLGGTPGAKPSLRYPANTFGDRVHIWTTAHGIEEA